MLITKYGIRHNEEDIRRRKTESLGPEVVTLPRIAASFAQATTTLYHRGLGRAITTFPELVDFPTAIYSPMFPFVARKGYVENNEMINIHTQLMLIAIYIDNILHLRDKPTPLDQIWTYYLTGHNSSVLLDEAKIRQCDDFNVTITGSFLPRLLAQRQTCIDRIRQPRPRERLGDIIQEMNTLA